MKHFFICILLMYFYTCDALGQVVVNGNVKSSTGESLPGVRVSMEDSSVQTSTNSNGAFEIVVPSLPANLTFSLIGMQRQVVRIDGRDTIEVVLENDEHNLSEVVVIGYGQQSRETLTFSVSKMDNKAIENVPFANAASALQGTVSGVRVQTTSGQPGASPRVIVRGGASIDNPNGAQPLYVVDGVIREDLEGINTADIESMQVLKDAAATAIYGARASNGVVIVTLKKGAVGKSVVSYNYSLGVSNLREKFGVLSASDFIHYGRLSIAASGEKTPARLASLSLDGPFGTGNDLTNNTAYTTQYLTDANRYKLDEGWESIPDPLDPSRTIIFANTDWQDVLFRTGVTHDHYLNFSGGSDKATFNLGVGYTDIEGVAIQTDYKRWSVNLNGRLQLRDNLYAYGSLNFNRFGDNVVYSENQLFERAIALAPTAKYRYEDGTLAPGTNRSLGNPEYHLSRSNNYNQENLVTLSGGLNWHILPDLVFEPVASLFYRNRENSTFQMSYFNTPLQFVDSRVASGVYTKWDQQQVDATLTYSKFIDQHNFQAKAGVSYFGRNNRSLSASGNGAASDLIPTLNASAIPVSVSSIASEQVIFGYFGRLTYDYAQKYLFTLNARYDGASNLGENNKYGFFPGVSVGWNMHKESFWPEQELLSTLKLRGSYGVNGNLGNLGDFQAYGEYSVGATYDGTAAINYTTLANQNLRWEQSRTLDFGLDAGLFGNRIQLIFDYYNRVTDNLITSLSLPHSTGFSNIQTNLGSLQNRGIELELGANIISKQDFSWDFSVNGSLNNNKILSLPENDNENNRIGGFYIYDPAIGDYAWRGGLQEGGRIGEMYGYQYLYVYATDQEAAAGPRDEIVATADKTKFGGDVAWLDVDGNNVIDTYDRVYMGNTFPKWTGGLSSSLAYKSFNLYVRMDYTTGHTIYNYVRANMDGQFIGNGNMSTDILRSWQNQGDQTDVPRHYWADQTAQSNYWRGDPRIVDNGRGSSQNYEIGDYLALREVTLSYTIPEMISRKVGTNNIRINVTGNNLKYFTKYSGLAPEEGGIDRGRYPVPMSLLFGIKASF